MDDLLKELNEPQKKAVLHQDGPLLVVAGAGAGKTKVITHRVANLIKIGVRPENILAVTFTNKAADEMKSRISQLWRLNLNSSSTNEVQPPFPLIGTFHSVCARILRANAKTAGLTRHFSILDKEDSLRIIKNCLKKLEINPKQFPPAKIQHIISRQKSDLVAPERFMNLAGENFFPKTIALVWQEYEQSLQKQKAADFDDLIAKTVFLFQEKPAILKKYQNSWLYILVDEYQDTNYAQYFLTKLLAREHKNICVVGDEDQSIYKFRGANLGNILNFEKDWPEALVVVLEQNYRSAQNILEAANAVIKRNSGRRGKKLFSELGEGNKLVIFDGLDEKDEAEFVACSSKDFIEKGINPSEIAVLYRANFQSRVLEEAFLKHGLPHQVVGTKFFERKEVRDIIAYLKSALNLQDNLSLTRIINEPGRGIGKASLINYLSGKKLLADKKTKIENFFEFLRKEKKVIENKPLSLALAWITEQSGYRDNLKDGSEEGAMRTDNLNELINLSAKYDSFKPPLGAEKFLEDVALLSNQDTLKNGRAVRLMTIHAAKGLEFSYVFVTGLEEGLSPYLRPGQHDGDEEEERRLFYVALTRAKKQVHFSFADSRNFFGGKQINKPSRFLNEIPQELFEQQTSLTTTNYLEI